MKKHFIKLANNPRILARRIKKNKKEIVKYIKYRYLFDYDTHQLLIKFESRKATYDFFNQLKPYTVDKFVYHKKFFNWHEKTVILTKTQFPDFSQYTRSKHRTGPLDCVCIAKNWNAFIEDRMHLDKVDRSLPFFLSVGGVSSVWKKPQYVLTEEEARENGLEPCFTGSNFYISNKHVIYIKQNDLYYKIDMTF